MPEVVLDSSALIAMIRGEPGGDRVAKVLNGATMTASNLAEVGDFYVREGASRRDVEQAIGGLRITAVDVDLSLALDASMLFTPTRTAGLSLADRLCLALAKRTDRRAVTADRAWSRVADGIGVEIEVIR